VGAFPIVCAKCAFFAEGFATPATAERTGLTKWIIVGTIVSILILFGICTIGGIIGADGAFALLGSSIATIATIAFGAVAYTAIFALLGVVFSATLLPGIVYYVVFELIVGAISVIEMLSLKFHLRLMGGFDTGEGGALRETLEQMLLDQSLTFDWWFGLLFTAMATAGAVVLSALLLKNRQFHV
jgi:ABC-2 type transport system permease protein